MRRRKTTVFKFIRSLLIIWLASVVLTGCATQQQLSQPSKPTHFITVIPDRDESLADIAHQYLGDSKLAFRISEFNNIDASSPNQPLVVPLIQLYPYGVRRTALQTVPVLSYHAFSWKTSNYMTIREKDFEAQMKYLKTNGYHVVPLSQMLDLFNGKELPEKSVVITIDDGWGSAYRIAYPILRKYDYPYTLFIQTNIINSAFKTLDWDQIREMLKNSNLSIGCHTNTHRDLTRPKKGESFTKYFSSIKQDLSLAKKIIFQETGINPIHLAYPYGNTNQLVMDLMKDLGYSTGYTINREPNTFLTNQLKLNRSMIFGTYNLKQFKHQLNSFEYFDLNSERLNNEIILNQPSESTAHVLETKGHWREALNHWHLIKDSLLQKTSEEYVQLNGQKPQASAGTSTVLYKNYENRIVLADQKIEQLENLIRMAANEHYKKGINYFSTHEILKATREMLKALYFNPELQKARNRLSQEINKPNYLTVLIRDGDTSKLIAKQTYKDATMFSLVSYYADKQGGLNPGMTLKLPKLSLIKSKPDIIKSNPKPPPEPEVKKVCGVVINKPKIELAKDFFKKAELLFNKDQIAKAKQSIKTSVCLNPENASAVELLKLFEGIAN
ncbi:MAG: polysaccharide deacetylase family protein [Methylococcales bacterium]